VFKVQVAKTILVICLAHSNCFIWSGNKKEKSFMRKLKFIFLGA